MVSRKGFSRSIVLVALIAIVAEVERGHDGDGRPASARQYPAVAAARPDPAVARASTIGYAGEIGPGLAGEPRPQAGEWDSGWTAAAGDPAVSLVAASIVPTLDYSLAWAEAVTAPADLPVQMCCCSPLGECRRLPDCAGYARTSCPCHSDSCEGGPVQPRPESFASVE
jgi:hypothetical protein